MSEAEYLLFRTLALVWLSSADSSADPSHYLALGAASVSPRFPRILLSRVTLRSGLPRNTLSPSRTTSAVLFAIHPASPSASAYTPPPQVRCAKKQSRDDYLWDKGPDGYVHFVTYVFDDSPSCSLQHHHGADINTPLNAQSSRTAQRTSSEANTPPTRPRSPVPLTDSIPLALQTTSSTLTYFQHGTATNGGREQEIRTPSAHIARASDIQIAWRCRDRGFMGTQVKQHAQPRGVWIQCRRPSSRCHAHSSTPGNTAAQRGAYCNRDREAWTPRALTRLVGAGPESTPPSLEDDTAAAVAPRR
ncbi:hypothetical protein BJ912DRAFT_1067466 [Pholiota molesta]|nr:hypothetical protein BJ912DRAFT_1067466 [Pholiota molesta]